MKSVKLAIFIGLFMGLAVIPFFEAFAQGSAALTVMEGEAGRALINKAIQSNSAARAFFADVLGVEAKKLVTMDPVLRQTQLLTRLNAKAPDQQALISKATGFIQTVKTGASDVSFSTTTTSSAEEIFGGVTVAKERLPLPPSSTTTSSAISSEPMLVKFTNQLVDRGEITETMGQEFRDAVTTTNVEGRDVVRCITKWQQAANRALYVKTIIAGAKVMPNGKAALGAISDTISRELGVSPEEARRRACALAGAGNISCSAYGEPILKACL